ncbi:MAG: XRE family transcriptional regulator [Anaeromicrobium sp.]|jgi:transcriptional regulator with XRE-family HTH domain|uniref:helix-turn-helix domain-containing protein n=1 Tax=Anaeromicrobium sp. TaxID=1929132 RepID=UPI0025D728C6|nr:XRE family transcriptional regulator [Anaeromicrobium sp.]MCT4593571.1 XRE family transcriptional regulator [Anaeromicrobium sp.]
MEIGSKIKSLRTVNGLTQEELAIRSDLTKGFISQIERDLTSPSIATLMDILEALGTDIEKFFSNPIEKKVVYTKEEIISSENDKFKHSIDWLISNAQKNVMEPILMTIESGGQSNMDKPHEGEEFGYVLSGSVYVVLGKSKYKVNKDESFYFKADKDHYLENSFKRVAKVIWVSCPPSF